jgi:hypothetical protein
MAQVRLTGGEESLHVNGARILADFLPLMGIQPALGRVRRKMKPPARGFDGPGLVAAALWRRSAVLGRSVTLDTNACTVIGILRRDSDTPFERTSVRCLPTARSCGAQSRDGGFENSNAG